MKIYNLFPRLAGRFEDWTPHLRRAAEMGFDWVFVNPIQRPGQSGSLYSIADHFALNEAFVTTPSPRRPEDQVRDMTATAQQLGLAAMIDLVINHCAKDSHLVREHPDWFVREGNEVASAFCVEADGNRVVWHDLAQFDHQHSPDRAGLFDYCLKMVEHLIDLGFRGFRCDAAYQIPGSIWRELITRIRARHPHVLFVAETLGCSPEQTRETAAAGFDAIFNSSKWWDYDGGWLLDQYDLTRQVAPSISFPESHDTERLFNESNGNINALKQRYLFSALFSSHLMMPIGYEFGFRRRLNVVTTRPEEWETTEVDLTSFIGMVNRIKDLHPVFCQEGPIERLQSPNPGLLMLRKSDEQGQDQAVLVLNKDIWNHQQLWVEDLAQLTGITQTLQDVSPEWPVTPLTRSFDFDLGPGMARVWVTPSRAGETRTRDAKRSITEPALVS
ncbi:alpha-amylase [Thiocapsa imhoffii]|uniref:Alpha-amylase n=1 Tax=Thiocapsa imhoffii TaxID=382777 RepID=A0A9X1B809_9GAMM|nr:alpha-amylase family glycosyl hydrolase [Thiocapsa imhoffii]MBK1643788.1 alpha-amylase [Thiocapsa imhoffii]